MYYFINKKGRVYQFDEIKFSYKINILIKFIDKMFANPKNLSHQQALEHIQSLFPSVSLPSFSSNITLKNILDVNFI